MPGWTRKGDATAPASSEVTESLCRNLRRYIQENCWPFFACCLSDVALGARRWRTMFRNNTGYHSNKLCLHQYALELKTKPGWRSPGLDAGFPEQCLLPYFIYSFLYQSVQYLHPLAGSCHSCRWQMALHSGIIRDAIEKGGGEAALLGLPDYAFLTPQIESNWKYLGNSGDSRLVYTADENNWPKCLYI